MGRYKRKSDRQNWTEENMKNALTAIQEQQMGWLLASKIFHVPFTTLRRRAKKGNDWKKGYLGGFKTTFDRELEQEIVMHIKNLESRFFGLTTNDVRKFAYQIAQAKGIKNKFSADTKMAGWDWLNGFRQRNPSISLRTPESTSVARASAFNKQQIGKYFHALAAVLDEFKFKPEEIWNVDEAGLSTVPSKNVKIFATRGRKQVGILSSAERGQHFTVVCCMNTAGTFVPPAIIFPRKNMKYELMDGAPIGSVAFCQETGWMNGDIFLKWMKHFVKYVKCSKERKILLLLDGHGSHKNLDVLTYAKENGVVMFCLPPHCTHRLQPLDVSFYSPLTTYYNQELSQWLKNHPGRVITHYQVAQLFNNAYVKAASLKTAQSGFSKTGIFPFNPDVFEEWMFAPSTVTELPVPPTDDATQLSTLLSASQQPDPNKVKLVNENSSHEPKTDGCNDPTTGESQIIHDISIEEILPLPSTSRNTGRPNRKRGSFGFINSTPELDATKAVIAEKQAIALQKSAKSTKKRLVSNNHSSNQQLRQSSRKKKKIVCNIADSSESEKENNEDTEEYEDIACVYCNELYCWSRSKELWFQCQICRKWAHAECAGLEPKAKTFVCDICV